MHIYIKFFCIFKNRKRNWFLFAVGLKINKLQCLNIGDGKQWSMTWMRLTMKKISSKYVPENAEIIIISPNKRQIRNNRFNSNLRSNYLCFNSSFISSCKLSKVTRDFFNINNRCLLQLNKDFFRNNL